MMTIILQHSTMIICLSAKVVHVRENWNCVMVGPALIGEIHVKHFPKLSYPE